MKLTPLFSGSSGNSILVESRGAKILVDVGVTAKKLSSALSELGISLSEINAVFVTHEHTDHIAGLGVLGRKAKIPVYMNEATWNAVRPLKGAPAESLVRIFRTGDDVEIGGEMTVKSFHTSHDAAESVGFAFSDGSCRVGIATDTGYVTDETIRCLSGCRAVLLEANHDVDILRTGSYPAALKARILSDRGHLSNACSGEALAQLVAAGTDRVILGHLSRENNNPVVALCTVRDILEDHGIKKDADCLINVARRDGITDGFEV